MLGKAVGAGCLVASGAQVTEGQGAAAVVEAMKMETELKSPKAGTVIEVLVREGQCVEEVNASPPTVERDMADEC